MTPTYTPKIFPDIDPDDVDALQDEIAKAHCTHVRDRKGRVWKIFNRLNKKSVPLNNAGDGPARLTFGQVESFGVTADPTPVQALPPEEETRLQRKERILSRENMEKVSMEVAVSKALYGWAKERQNEIDRELKNGQTIKVTNARGVHISTIGKSNPQPKFVIEDMAAALPAAMDDGAEIVDLLPADQESPEYAAAVHVLNGHAPHLLRPTLTEEEYKRIAEQVQKQWEITGQVPAGWTIQEARPGSTSVRVSKVGKEIVSHLLEGTKGVLEITKEGNNDE